MMLSMNIILDSLQSYRITNYFSLPSDKRFLRPALLPSDCGAMNEDKLYVCRLSAAMEAGRRCPGKFSYICLRDRIEDSQESPELMQNMVVVNENISFEALFEQVQDTFAVISGWYADLQELVIKNCTLQEIVDASEPILKNYVQLTDYAFKLLAYTRNTDCDEPITVLAREFGYHPEETIKRFKKLNRMEAWERSSGSLLVNDDHKLSKYTMVSKIFRFRGSYFAHAVMTCNKCPATDGLKELFAMFMDIVGIYVERDWQSSNGCTHSYDSFIIDLLDGNLTREDTVAERARFVNIPTSGKFSLFVTSSDGDGRLSIGRIATELCQLFPNGKVVLYKGHVAMLTMLNQGNTLPGLERVKNDMQPLLEKYDIRCGISALFEKLTGIRSAFKQAKLALDYSGRTPGAELLPQLSGAPLGLNRRTVAFEESCIYALLDSSPENRSIWRESVYHDALVKLRNYDVKHNTNNLELLYVFLSYERRSTETAGAMMMSRNNVVYRIGRIEEMLDLDLSIPATRLKLSISYIMLQLYGFDE